MRPYHGKQEDKTLIDREMKCLCHLGILKEGFLAYSSPIMLISRKLTQDKRVLAVFRHFNIRVAKTNLAYPLCKDIFSVLRSSKYEGIISIRHEEYIPVFKAIRRLKILRDTSLLWQHTLSIPKDA